MTRKVAQNIRPSFSHVRGGAGHETRYGRGSEWDTVMWTNLASVLSSYNLKEKRGEYFLLDEQQGRDKEMKRVG